MSDRVEMAIACLYDISYLSTTSRSNGTRWPWWNPNRCYPLEGNCVCFSSSAYGRFLLEEDLIILLGASVLMYVMSMFCDVFSIRFMYVVMTFPCHFAMQLCYLLVLFLVISAIGFM